MAIHDCLELVARSIMMDIQLFGHLASSAGWTCHDCLEVTWITLTHSPFLLLAGRRMLPPGKTWLQLLKSSARSNEPNEL
tara:strand:- start:1070 stop:1309 length:240 start_codon:yes stop_codon:yes gene_type:complete